MPSPQAGESKDGFISRCMGSAEAKEDFPDRDQRLAFCYSQWDDVKKDMDTIGLDLEPAQIAKLDEDQHLVFGWFNVAVRKDGKLLTDMEEDVVEVEELEKAAYDFVIESRQGGVMHQGNPKAVLVESIVITPEKLEKMGLPPDAVPARWWGGFKVLDGDTWSKVKKGELKMFSIEGEAVRVETE